MEMMINTNIVYLRRLAGFQQVEMANLLKVGRSTISNYEKGNTVPDANGILELCRYFGISADYALFVDLEGTGVLIDDHHKVYNVPEMSAAMLSFSRHQEMKRIEGVCAECEKTLALTRELLAAKVAHISSLERLVEVLEGG